MKTRGNFIWATVIVLTILFGIGTTVRLASANEVPTCPEEPIYSATLEICAYQVDNPSEVRLHRVTESWTESEVTWNTAPGYDSTVVRAFTPSVDCISVDVTALVQGWIDNSYANYGILLEQGITGLTRYRSSEYNTDPSLRPKLEICYASDNCITIQDQDSVADAYIWALYPDMNFGSSAALYTGILNDYEKDSLIRFEIPTCLWTRTPGYWKNHPAAINAANSCWNGGQTLLPLEGICGVDIIQTNPGIPGATSEALSVATHGWYTQLQLARQCTAAALNQKAMEAAMGSYGDVVDQLIANCCEAGGVCGNFEASESEINNCVDDLDDFNNSGESVNNVPFGDCPAYAREARVAKRNDITIFSDGD